MKISQALQDYTRRTEQALFSNPPRQWPVYETDPVAAWRYLCRLYGHGLAQFDEREVQDVCKTLYGSWFVRCEFSHKLPKVDSRDFVGWILDARREALRAPQPPGD